MHLPLCQDNTASKLTGEKGARRLRGKKKEEEGISKDMEDVVKSY